jgi:clan AA aspartic protease
MITGNVTAQREARLRLELLAANQPERQVEVVLDTGFNGYLTHPGSIIRELQLRSVGARPVTLGDGSRAVLNLYRAHVRWHDEERRVLILQTDGDPLLGMALLYGNRVILNVVDDGDVAIDPLP